MIRLLAALLLAVAAPAAALAQEQVFHSSERWLVKAAGPSADGVMCAAATGDQRAGTYFGVFTIGRSQIMVGFGAPSWPFPDGQQTVIVDIDGNRTNVTVQVQGGLLQGFIDPGVIDRVARGRTVTLRTATGQALSAFDMAGSAVAMGALEQCRDSY